MLTMWDGLVAQTADLFVRHGLRILLAMLGAWVAHRFLNSLIRYLVRKSDETHALHGLVQIDRQQTQTVAAIVGHAGTILILFVSGLVILTEIGFNPAPLLASAGIVGVAFGLGTQSLVKDVIAGLFVLSEDQFRVGDVIKTGLHSGLVESLTLRTTSLRDVDGAYHIIPNGDLGRVTNYGKTWARALIEVDVAYQEDLNACLALLTEVAHKLAADWPERVTGKPEILGVEKLGDTGITLRMMAQTAPLKQWEVSREWRKRIKEAFTTAGIENPYPLRVTLQHPEGEPGLVPAPVGPPAAQ